MLDLFVLCFIRYLIVLRTHYAIKALPDGLKTFLKELILKKKASYCSN